MAVTTLEVRPEYRLGHVGSVIVIVWYHEPTVAALDSIARHHQSLAAGLGKVTLFSIIVSGTNTPPVEVRNKIQEQAPVLQKLRHGSVVVVQAKGLGAIFIRSYLAVISLISTEQLRVAKTLDEAAKEIRDLPGQDEQTKSNLKLGEQLKAFVDIGPPTQAAAAPPPPPP